MRAPVLAALLAFGTSTAQAEILEGRVVAVADGDTITILEASKRQHRIRINGIDAPEKRQAFGERAKQSLSNMAFQKDARLDCHKTDRYGRKVCKVWVQPSDCPTCGKTLDVGYAQVLAGLAWWYRAYAKEQTAEDQGRYESAEQEARLRKWGLWQEREPVPPWEWRQRKRK
jgi:endonuclease YncB( thermonuclease family)